MRDEPYPRFRKAILLSLLSATWTAAIASLVVYAMPETAWSVIVAFRPTLGKRRE